MKKWSRKKKLLLCVVFLLLSLFFIATIIHWPSPTLEIAIRRKEKQQLVGPSAIIGHIEYGYQNDDHIFLGKTDSGWITYEYIADLGWDSGELRYFPKEESATLFCTDFLLRTEDESWLPIFVFPENPDYTLAEMTISISCLDSSDVYRLDGEKQGHGGFLFSLPGANLDTEYFWLLQQAVTNSYQEYVLTGTVDIQIDFYDRSGKLVNTYTNTVIK